jgi:hypothetical protein
MVPATMVPRRVKSWPGSSGIKLTIASFIIDFYVGERREILATCLLHGLPNGLACREPHADNLNETLGVAIDLTMDFFPNDGRKYGANGRGSDVETDLVTFAAQDFARKPVARIQLPVRVPLGFHSSWIADN